MKKSSRNMFMLLIPLLVVVALYFASEMIVPKIAERMLEENLSAVFNGDEAIKVEASSFPAVKMLFKKFDKVTVHADKAVISETEIFDFNLLAKDIDLANIANGFTIENLKNSQASFAMKVSDVNELYISKVGITDDLVISLDKDLIAVNGTFTILGMDVLLSAIGKFEVVSDNVVRYSLTDIKIADNSLPSTLIGLARDFFDFSFALNDIPYGIKLTGIHTDDSRDLIYFEGHI